MTGYIPIHYKPYEDEPTVCGATDGKFTTEHDDTTCNDCAWEMQ